MIKNFKTVFLAISLSLSFASFAQIPTPNNETASPALMDHFYREVTKWVEGAPTPTTTGLPPASAQAIRDADFLQTRSQLRQLGTKAWPMAARLADLLGRTTSKQYELGWMIMDMTPALDSGETTVNQIRAKYDNAQTLQSEKLILIAQLGRIQHPAAVKQIEAALSGADAPTRLMSTIALGYAGKSDGSKAATLLANQLKDPERYNRTAAANSIRLIGRPAAGAAQALGEYLRTKDNIYMACRALQDMPIEAIRPLKSVLESIVNDNNLTTFQKQDAVNLLLRIEAEPAAAPARAVG